MNTCTACMHACMHDEIDRSISRTFERKKTGARPRAYVLVRARVSTRGRIYRDQLQEASRYLANSSINCDMYIFPFPVIDRSRTWAP